MINDPMTLYKLMILYMLDQVNFPLTGNQISSFILGHEYTNYFTLGQAQNELIESGLISQETIHNTSRYTLTSDGEQTLEFFGKNIPAAIVDDMDDYIRENRFKMRNEVGTTADYYKSTNQDYIVHCEVREGKSVLIGLDLSAPDEKTAIHMCSRWKEKSTEIYSGAVKALMSEN